jgi:hypothetical protein
MKKGAIDLKSVVFDEESKSGPGGLHGHGHAIHPCQRDSVLHMVAIMNQCSVALANFKPHRPPLN